MADNIIQDEIEAMTKRLRLPHIRRSYYDLALSARAQRWDPMEMIRLLLEIELKGRNASTLEIRRIAANLPSNRTLEGFDSSISSIPNRTIMGLSNLEWVRRKENLLVLGPPGTGKSFLAEALASAGIEAGFRVAWYTPETLCRYMDIAKATDTLAKMMLKLMRMDLIVIDDLGILPMDSMESESLYRAVDACYEKTSMIVTSNYPIASFDEIITPRSLAAALVDRLAHHAHLIETKGDSIRLSQALSGKGVVPL
jgi:DNA replication protein DnaC